MAFDGPPQLTSDPSLDAEDCKVDLPSKVPVFRDASTASLLRAGFRVVNDPRDALIVLHETIVVGLCRGGAVQGSWTLAIKGGGRLIDQQTISNLMRRNLIPTIGDAALDRHSDELIGKVASSVDVASYATAHQGDSLPSHAATAATPAPNAAPPVSATTFAAGARQPSAYAIVIGVEKYAGGFPPPVGARSDAERFASLAKSSLGVAPDHVQVILDDQAGKAGVERAIEWVRSSVPAGGRIYFYFSGHGAPAASAGTPYIVPADGDPKYLEQTAISMKEVLTKLGQSNAREVLAVVDTCFSGAGGRSVLPAGARPLVRVKTESAPAQLALFAASSGAEISGPVSGGSGGLFTKYVLDGLGSGAADINGDGQVSLSELSTWVAPRVAREAKKDNRDQNPSLTVGKGLGAADGFIVEWGLPAR